MYTRILGNGTPLLCIHGFPLDHRSLLPLDRIFGLSGNWKRIYVDLPGMGKSSYLTGINGYSSVLDNIQKIIDEEIGSDEFAIFGYSFGGMLARALTYMNSEKVLGLGMLCPEIIANNSARNVPVRIPVITDKSFLASLDPAQRSVYTKTSIIETRENFEKFNKYILPAFSSLNKQTIDSIASNTELIGIPEPKSYKFYRPTLFITGRQDNLVGYIDAYNIIENYPHASYAILDGAGHTAHLDQSTLVDSLIQNWLERINNFKEDYS